MKTPTKKNRYGNSYYYQHEGGKTWSFRADSPIGYIRFIGNPIYAFDPSGGPYVSVGDKIDEKTIVKIYLKDKIIYLDVN